MPTLQYITDKFRLDPKQRSPISILEINRTIMAQTLAELGFKVGAEIGVAKGEHAEILCLNNPGLKLYCIDPWTPYHGYLEYISQLAWFYEEAKHRLAPFDCVIVRKFSMNAVSDFPDKSLDFVYIDGAHDFRNVADDICEWEKKVRPDGILFGHDYKRPRNNRYVNHVVDVVNAYAYSHGIVPWFILGTQGEHDGLFREGTRSWMWVVK